MNRTELIILLTFSGVGTIAAIFLAVRWIIMRGIAEDVKKTKVRHDIDLELAVESLEQIANDMDEWIQQQREKFKHTTKAFRKKWISRWFSDFFIMELFRDKVHKRQFDDIVETFRWYMPNTVESLKEIRNNFLSGAKFMKQIEMHKNEVESGHKLGFWCINFFDTTASPTVERLRGVVELAREYLTAQKQEETAEKRPNGVLDKQVGKLLRSSPLDVSASEIARILNNNFVGVYKPISPCLVGKTEHWKKHREKIESCRKK